MSLILSKMYNSSFQRQFLVEDIMTIDDDALKKIYKFAAKTEVSYDDLNKDEIKKLSEIIDTKERTIKFLYNFSLLDKAAYDILKEILDDTNRDISKISRGSSAKISEKLELSRSFVMKNLEDLIEARVLVEDRNSTSRKHRVFRPAFVISQSPDFIDILDKYINDFS